MTNDVAFKKNEIQDPVTMYKQDVLGVQANLTGLPAIAVPVKNQDYLLVFN